MPYKAATPTTHPDKQPPPLDEQRYARLLALRVAAGSNFFDRLSHGEHDGLLAINDECNRLDEILEADQRYAADYSAVVLTAEQARMHVPGRSRPDTEAVMPCNSCRRDTSGLAIMLALPRRGAA